MIVSDTTTAANKYFPDIFAVVIFGSALEGKLRRRTDDYTGQHIPHYLTPLALLCCSLTFIVGRLFFLAPDCFAFIIVSLLPDCFYLCGNLAGFELGVGCHCEGKKQL